MLVGLRRFEIKGSYRYLLTLSIVLGALLRFYQIGNQSLWLDESLSNWFSSITIHELWTVLPKTETNPPLYYTILKIWKYFFGTSELGLRSLSAVVSLGCIPLIFIMGRMLGKSANGDLVGSIAALFFAVSPIQIQYAQEVRSYAMLTFATTLTLCTVLWIVLHPSEACEPIFRKPSKSEHNVSKGVGYLFLLPWITMVIAITLTLWIHNTTPLFILTLYLIMLVWFSFELRFNKTFFLNMATVSVVSFILWSPYLFFLIKQTKNANLPIPEPTFLSTVSTIIWLFLGQSISWISSPSEILKIIIFLLLILLSSLGLIFFWRKSGKYVSILIFGAILGPIVMELLFSILYRPIFLARTLIYLSIPFYLAVAAGLMMLRNHVIRASAIILIIVVSLKWTHTFYSNSEKEQKEPWDKIAHSITEQGYGGVVLLLPNNLELPFSYYANRTRNINIQLLPLPFPTANFLHPSPELASLGADVLKALQIKPAIIPTLKTAITNKTPVWLITRREELFDPDRIVYNFLIEQKGLIFKRNYGEMSVFKFE
jgi:mannosyltransferase